MRLAVAFFALVLFVAGPLVPGAWLYTQHLDGGVCRDAPPGTAGWTHSVDVFPPRVTCTYVLPARVVVVQHDAAHRDVAAALMAMGLVLAVAAYSARPRRSDEAAAAHG